jgi:sec-independent protein translocase protein TatA
MPNVGPMEILLLVGLALLLFGPKRLPEIGRSLGKGMREFKTSLDSATEGARAELDEVRELAQDARPVELDELRYDPLEAPEDEAVRVS